MKRAIASIGVMVLLVLTLIPIQASGQNTISVQNSFAQVSFPANITFNISAKSGAELTDIRLRYTINRESFANEFAESYVQFKPAISVNATWVLDMQKTGGLPTGTALTYRWVIKDASGNRLETSPQQISFNDNRYTWKDISQGNITIYWYQGDNAFANQLMGSAQSALTRLEGNTGATISRPIKMYIYASAQDLQGSMIFPSEWTGGVAFVEYGIIAIGIAPSNLAWGQRAISHELTHLVIHQMTYNPYNGLPTWLDEGLAVYNEGPADPTFTALLSQAIADNQLISARSLSSPFSAYSNEATLSYAESHSFVNYLISAYGQQKMLLLLNTFHQGSTYDGAFQKVYGFDMDGLYSLWKQKVSPTKTARALELSLEWGVTA